MNKQLPIIKYLGTQDKCYIDDKEQEKEVT